MKKYLISSIVVWVLTFGLGFGDSGDPLSSWNAGHVKEAIVGFVNQVTDAKQETFVPAKDRVAVFDLDGTLLSERPVNFQLALAVERLRELVKENPKLKEQQPYKAVWEGDADYYNAQKNHSYVFLTAFNNCTSEYYHKYAKDFVKVGEHSLWQKKYDQLLYIPGVELVDYLKRHDFDVYVCTTSEEGCVRALLGDALGIDTHHVIGNEVDYAYRETKEGKQEFVMTGRFKEMENRDEGKVLYINNEIGKQPIFAFGNAGGDRAMLKYTSENHLPNFTMILDHDDAVRESEYHSNGLLENAKREGWEIVSMKQDFKRVFSFD